MSTGPTSASGGQAPAWGAEFDAELRAKAAAEVAAKGAAVSADPWRQRFHVQPPVGLLNDPNGLVQHEGTYHLCFQWHPFGAKHAQKFWAYRTSTDLVHWTEQPIALAPSDTFDSHGCYSGSGIVHDGQVRFLYTGNVRTPDGGRTPFQCLATVQPDGTVVKHPANPLIGAVPGCTGHIRDPKVWAVDDGYLMVLGAQTEDMHGTLLLFHSADLLAWDFLGHVAGGADDAIGYMWECPDLLRLAGKDVLVVSPQFDYGPDKTEGRYEDVACYTIGTLTLDPPRFTHGELHRMEAGFDFYAPQTFPDDSGRTILIGWMGMPDHDGQPTLAEKHPTVANGWVHCLTVPRTVELVDDRLVQWPVAELDALHGPAVTHSGVSLAEGEPVSLAGVAGEAFDLTVSATCEPGAALRVGLREGGGQVTVLTVDPNGSATLDRSASGPGEGGAATGSYQPAPGQPAGSVSVRVLVDSSSVEVFVDGGRLVQSARIYPGPEATGVTFTAVGGGASLGEVTCYPM